MELLESEVLRRRILESYSKDPRGWSFVISPSRSGFYDALVSGPESAWMLKIDSIFKPLPMVLGAETNEHPGLKLKKQFPYGYRSLQPELVLQMLGGGEGQTPRDRMLASFLSVLRSEPVVPEPGMSYAQGPFVLTSSSVFGLSESQREIDTRLASEMRRLVRGRYPAYG